MAKGWIKLHRKIWDNWIWEDPEKLRAWLDILLMVNHEDKNVPYNGKMITIKAGQKLTSINKLSERWGWSKHRVYRFFLLLKEDNMCYTNGTTSGTIITVVNWESYQSVDNTDGTTNGTPNGTASGTTNGTQTRMIKNDKEGGEDPQPHYLTDDEAREFFRKREEAMRNAKTEEERIKAKYGFGL